MAIVARLRLKSGGAAARATPRNCRRLNAPFASPGAELELRRRRAIRIRVTITRIGRSATVSNKRSGRRIMCQMNTIAIANFENRAVDSAWATRWVSSQISPANWARAKMATAIRAKIGLATRAEAAHHRRSRPTMVPIKARTNRILKDRAKEPKSSERRVARAASREGGGERRVDSDRSRSPKCQGTNALTSFLHPARTNSGQDEANPW